MIIPPRLRCAVPGYLEETVYKSQSLPPGHIFNLYAPMWTQETFGKDIAIWEIGNNVTGKKENAKKSIEGIAPRKGGVAETLEQTAKKYHPDVDKYLKAVISRQKRYAQNISEVAIIPINLTAPLAVGLGNEHPVENGFSFLTPYGLPYIAGSGIKGVLRDAAAQVEDISEEDLMLLFGKDDNSQPSRGALSFWDGLPDCNRMVVEVMTPHNSKYYQGDCSPHDQGQPTPILFIAVPANTKMNLIVQCDESRLPKGCDWRQKVENIVKHAGEWMGFGGKTAVGYGAFELDSAAAAKLEEERKNIQEELKKASMTPEEIEIEEFNKALKIAIEKKDFSPNGELNRKRAEFMKKALNWKDKDKRVAAAEIIEASYKSSGWPSTKKKNEIKGKLEQLKS